MTTYLQLSKDTRLECDIPGTGPSSVSDTNLEMIKILQWVKVAWREIQNASEMWRWMRVNFTLSTKLKLDFTSGGTTAIAIGDTITGDVSGSTAVITKVNLTPNAGTWAAGTAEGSLEFSTQTGTFVAENLEVSAVNLATIAEDSIGVDEYAPGDITDDTTNAAITRFKEWIINDIDNPPVVFLASDGVGTQRWMVWTTWANYKTLYRIGTVQPGPPVHIAIDPQNNLVIGPKPGPSLDGPYTITGEYRKSAQILAADGDEPEMPEDFHYLIVYRALEKYGWQESASEVIDRAQLEGGREMTRLRRNQLPHFKRTDPLA